MKINNLSEEIYKMRKLMNFNSSHYRENITSYDKLLEERILKKHLLKEEGEDQVETKTADEPKFYDWSKGGSVNWENAKIKDIVKYVREVDEYIDSSIKNNPSYEVMMEWFIANDSPDTRSSLKNWMFGEIYYGLKKGTPTKVTKKNEVKPDKYDEDMQKNIPVLLSKISIDTLKSKITDSGIKEKSVDKTVKFCVKHLNEVVKDLESNDLNLKMKHIKTDYKPESGDSLNDWASKYDFSKDIENIKNISECLFNTDF